MQTNSTKYDYPNDLPWGARHGGADRGGFSLLEFEVALTLLGIALVGLFPLVVMHSRSVRTIERRLPSNANCYLVPSSSDWARKLGAAARITTTPPAARAPPPVLLVDNGEDGYSESGGGWTTVTDAGAFQGQYRARASQDAPLDTASWRFTGLTPGRFQVQATWLEAPERSTNAAYTVYDGDTAHGTYPVSQRLAPLGTVFNGRPWETLTTLWINGDNARAELSAQNDGSVAADGVRLVPLENDVRVLSLDRSMNSEEVQVRVQVNVLVP